MNGIYFQKLMVVSMFLLWAVTGMINEDN